MRNNRAITNQLGHDQALGDASLILFIRHTNFLEVAAILLWIAAVSHSDRSATDVSAVFDYWRLVRGGLVGFAAIILVATFRGLPIVRWSPQTLFLLFSLIGILSTIWSLNPLVSVGKAGEVFTGVAIVYMTFLQRNYLWRLRRLISWTLLLYGAYLFIAFCGYFIFPDVFSSPSRGLISRQIASPQFSSNALSNTGALISVVCFTRYMSLRQIQPDRIKYFIISMFFALIPILAQGRTGQTALVVGMFLASLRRRGVANLMMWILPIALVIYFFGDVLWSFFLRGQTDELFRGLSGRWRLWEFGVSMFASSPFIGNGFGVGSRSVFSYFGTEGYSPFISSLHNGFLEVLLGVGLLGFIPWVSSFIWAIYLATKAYIGNKNLDIVLMFPYFVTTTVMSLGIGGWNGIECVLFIAATSYLFFCNRELSKPFR